MKTYSLTIKSSEAPVFKTACLHNNVIINSITKRKDSLLSDVEILAQNPTDLFYIGMDFINFKKSLAVGL